MDVDYARQLFLSAIRSALVSDAGPQAKLAGLISTVGPLQRENFPDEQVWGEFRRLVSMTAGCASRQPGEAESQITSLEMPDQEAAECLQAALNIFSHLASVCGMTAVRI